MPFQELEAAFDESVRRFEGSHFPLLAVLKGLNADFACTPSQTEGLVLKPANASYDRHQWQKMKRDYIPGLADTVDLVLLGASWDAQRGRELNGMRFLSVLQDVAPTPTVCV